MRIECPSCGVSGTADHSYCGKKIRCPKCDEVFCCQQEDELAEIAEEVELLEVDEVEDEAEEVKSSSPDLQEDVSAVEDIAEDLTEELVDLSDAAPEQLPDDDDLFVELCDYCTAKGKPGERFEIVDNKKACSDCVPILVGEDDIITNDFQPPIEENQETQNARSGSETQVKNSLAGKVFGRFKKLFSR